VRNLPGLDTTGLAASLPTFGLAGLPRKEQRARGGKQNAVGACSLAGVEQANVVRGNDLKVRPTECIDIVCNSFFTNHSLESSFFN